MATDTTKLLGSRRGGYCFDHNALYLVVLHRLGFEARPILARVLLNAQTPRPPLTHVLAMVRSPGGDWIADVDFGGGAAPPKSLVECERMDRYGTRFRLRAAGLSWILWRGDRPQYQFDRHKVSAAELAEANLWTSTAAESRFTQTLVVSRLRADGLQTLSLPRLCDEAGGQRIDSYVLLTCWRTGSASAFRPRHWPPCRR